MNEKLQDILISTLEKAQQASGKAVDKAIEVGGKVVDAAQIGFDKAVDFAKEQIPDVINQMMMWEFTYHLAWGLFWVAVSLVFLGLGVVCWKWSNKYHKDIKGCYSHGEAYYLLKLPMWVVIFVLLIGTIPNGIADNFLVCAKIKFAPKVFLIEYCSDLIKARTEANKVYVDRQSGREYQGSYTPVHNH
jgi:hypothetical protein